MTLKDDLKHEKMMSATFEKLSIANMNRAIEMEQRAEAAEAEAAALREQLAQAQQERAAAVAAEREANIAAVEKLISAAYEAVGHVSSANYPERQDHAYKLINDAASAIRARING